LSRSFSESRGAGRIDLFLFAIAFKGAWDSARAVSMMGMFLAPGAALQLTGFLERVGGWLAPKDAPPEVRKETGKRKGKQRVRPPAVTDDKDVPEKERS
jgi:hypothetical protein